MGQFHHLYNSRRWRARRVDQLKHHPLCVMCASDGRVTAATVADHKEPHQGNIKLFWEGPLQSLCESCHNKWKQQIEKTGGTSQVDIHGAPKKNF